MRSDDGLTVVVLAGAVARGPFEAAVLTELLPKLVPDLRNTLFIGTSAGAINAVLWARFATAANTSVAEIGRAVEAVWKTIEYDDVLASLFAALGRLVFTSATSFLTRRELASLLDASPLRGTVESYLAVDELKSNIDSGRVAGVGVVATACGDKVASSRSHVFLQTHASRASVAKSPDSGVDYFFEPLTVDHVLASSAVPALFQPIQLTAGGITQSYVDGGVRLNTPIAPATSLGTKRIVVVSSHTARYFGNVATPQPFRISDAVARALHSVLADGMIEDVRRLLRINDIVRQVRAQNSSAQLRTRSGRVLQEVELIVVSPDPGQLAQRASEALDEHERWSNKARYRLLEGTLGFLGRGEGMNEILSYFFFDRTYTLKQLDLGRERAQKINRWDT